MIVGSDFCTSEICLIKRCQVSATALIFLALICLIFIGGRTLPAFDITRRGHCTTQDLHLDYMYFSSSVSRHMQPPAIFKFYLVRNQPHPTCCRVVISLIVSTIFSKQLVDIRRNEQVGCRSEADCRRWGGYQGQAAWSCICSDGSKW